MNKGNTNFEESIRNSVSNAELAPSNELWERLAASIESGAVTPIVPLRTRVLRWGSAAAAAILIAASATAWITTQNSISETEAYIAQRITEFEKITPVPIALKDVKLAQATPKIVTAKSAKHESSTTPQKSVEATKPTTPKKSVDKGAEVAGEQPKSYSAPRTQAQYNRPQHHEVEQPKRLSLSLLAAGGSHSTAGVATPPQGYSYSLDQAPLMIPISSSAELLPTSRIAAGEINHHSPIIIGVNAAFSLNEKLSVETGVSYSLLRSDIVDSQLVSDARQTLQFVGLPLRLTYKFIGSKQLQLYTGVGGQIERCISAKIGSLNYIEKTVHYSTSALLGAQYNINEWIGIYAEPEAVYYLTPTKLTTIRTENPFDFNMRFGLRFSIK